MPSVHVGTFQARFPSGSRMSWMLQISEGLRAFTVRHSGAICAICDDQRIVISTRRTP